MAKIAFSKFGAKPNTDVEIYTFQNAKGDNVEYEIIKYLPYKDKLILLSDIINQSIDDNGYYNPMRLKLYMVLGMVYAYTNLSFTDKMKEDPFKLYDTIINTNIVDNIIKTIGDSQWKEIENGLKEIIENIYKYKNSIMGILDTISQDYSAVDMDLSSIQEKLADPNALQLIKEILPLMNNAN